MNPVYPFLKPKFSLLDSDYIAETIHNNQKKACCSLVLCYSHMQRFSLCLSHPCLNSFISLCVMFSYDFPLTGFTQMQFHLV